MTASLSTTLREPAVPEEIPEGETETPRRWERRGHHVCFFSASANEIYFHDEQFQQIIQTFQSVLICC